MEGSAVVVSVVRGADTFGASEVEGSVEGSAVVVSVVRGADAFGASEDADEDVDEVADEDVVVETSDVVGDGVTEVVTDDGAAEEVTSVVVGVGSFASSSSRFSCASTTRKNVRSSSACALLISGA